MNSFFIKLLMLVMSVARIGMADTGHEIMKYLAFSQALCIWCADAHPKQEYEKMNALCSREGFSLNFLTKSP
jgi:hypothetical protein